MPKASIFYFGQDSKITKNLQMALRFCILVCFYAIFQNNFYQKKLIVTNI